MADKTMKLEIMSPDRNFYTGEVTMAEFNTTEGYIGVYPEHIPLTVWRKRYETVPFAPAGTDVCLESHGLPR